MSLYYTPIGKTVEALQDAGRNVYIWGFTTDGRRALVVDSDRRAVSVAPIDSNALGRWECTPDHLRDYAGIYGERFPRRD